MTGLSLSIGLGLHSRRAAVAATVAAAFALANWSLANANADPTNNGVNDGVVNVTINSYPDNGGSLISDIEYRIDGGAWTSAQTISSFTITGLTNAVSRNIELRAINGVGASNASDVKAATPYVKGGGWARVATSFIPATVKSLKADYGAAGNAIVSRTGSATASSTTFTDPNASFVAGDVGKAISIKGAGALNSSTGFNKAHHTTIAAVTNGTTITLTLAAVSTASNTSYVYGTDDTTALTNAKAGANFLSGNGLHIEAGQYYYTGNLNFPTAGRTGTVIYGDGPQSSVLVCASDCGPTSAESGHLLFQAFTSNCVFRDFQISHPLTTDRVSGGTSALGYGIWLVSCADCTFTNVWINGQSSGHVIAQGANITFTYSTAGDGGGFQGADGFHIDSSSTGANFTCQYCRTVNVGDDAFAAIGASTDSPRCSGVNFLDNLVEATGSTHGGGVHIDGWNNGQVLRNRIISTSGAGIRLSSKSSFNGGSVDTVLVDSNILISCVDSTATDPGLAPIHLDTSEANQTITNVTISNNTITGSDASTVGIKFSASSATEPISATVTNNAVTSTGGSTITAFESKSSNVTITDGGGNTYNGVAAAA